MAIVAVDVCSQPIELGLGVVGHEPTRLDALSFAVVSVIAARIGRGFASRALRAKQACRKSHLLVRFRTTKFPTIRRFILTFQAIWLSESFLLRMVCFRNVYSFSP